jgi:hypothetical protein
MLPAHLQQKRSLAVSATHPLCDVASQTPDQPTARIMSTTYVETAPMGHQSYHQASYPRDEVRAYRFVDGEGKPTSFVFEELQTC